VGSSPSLDIYVQVGKGRPLWLKTRDAVGSSPTLDTMNISKSLQRIDKLNHKQLCHALQLSEEEIVRYKESIRNYSTPLMESIGLPFLKKLEETRDQFLLKLKT